MFSLILHLELAHLIILFGAFNIHFPEPFFQQYVNMFNNRAMQEWFRLKRVVKGALAVTRRERERASFVWYKAPQPLLTLWTHAIILRHRSRENGPPFCVFSLSCKAIWELAMDLFVSCSFSIWSLAWALFQVCHIVRLNQEDCTMICSHICA